MGQQAWETARNVLCVRLDTIGDVLMTTPAIRALCRPERRITLLTSPAGADVAGLVPEIDDVIVYPAPWLKASARGPSEDDARMIDGLRRRRFDGAVIFTVYTQSAWPAALLCHLAGIPRRLAHLREKAYGLLTDWVPDPEPNEGIRHEVRRQLDLVAAIGARTEDERLSLRVPEEADGSVRTFLSKLDLGSRWAVIHPGATAPSRRYPSEHFVEVLRGLAAAGWAVVLSGSVEEADLVDDIRRRSGVPAHSLAGRLSVADLAALLRLAPVLISNNTGPVHVAAAVGTPVVDLYALTNPQHTPWGVPNVVLSHDVPCRNCQSSICLAGHHDCLRRVAPADVVQATLRLAEAATSVPSRSASQPTVAFRSTPTPLRETHPADGSEAFR
jgi:lipopolysaccharide heptosyltransferase II